jgi:hypothetical protein
MRDRISHIEKIAFFFFKAAKKSEPSRKDYMREYMKKRYREKRDALIKELGGKCAVCGSTKGLHVDHIDKKKKTMRAADIHSVNDKALQKEKKNFQLLCDVHHKEKTRDSWDYSTPKPRHGTVWMYRKYECRCPKCVKAYEEYLESNREKRKSK